jgi:tripartite-type tricarboxylate transporter receptor subunit TctC
MRPLDSAAASLKEAAMMRRIMGLLSIVFLVSATYLHAKLPQSGHQPGDSSRAGDAADVAGRTMGEELSKLLKVPVVAVNRPGGG